MTADRNLATLSDEAPFKPPIVRMADRVKEKDWSATVLGAMAAWPPALRTAVSICLNSRFPMFVWWGPELINIYNDSYVPILGKRHPDALGLPAKEIWGDIWSVIGPQADAVMQRGEATWNDRVLLVMERHGFPEDTYFTWSYSPIHDDAGRVAGLFCACTEETQHVIAERERDLQTAQRQVALDAARMGWWTFETASNRVSYDRRFAEIFGFESTDSSLDEILQVVHPEDLPGLWQKFEAAIASNGAQPYAAEYRVVLPDRTIRWVDAHGQAISEAGRYTGLVGTVTDVTTRKDSEAALLANERRFRALATAGASVLYRMNADWSDLRSLEGQGLLADERQHGSSWLSAYIEPEDRPAVLVAIQEAVQNKRTFELEHRVRLADGSMGWSFSRVVPLQDERGEIIEWIGTAQDVSERRRGEETLRETQRRLRLAEAAANVGLWELDLVTGAVIWSDGLFHLLGLRPGSLLPSVENWNIYLHPEDRNWVMAQFQKDAASGAREVYSEFRIVRADGVVRWLNSTAQIFYDSSNRPVRAFGGNQDITDRKEFEDALLQARERADFLSRALEDSSLPFASGNPDGTLSIFNRAFVELTGYADEELRALTWSRDLTPPEWQGRESHWLEELHRSGRPQLYEKEYLRKDGTRVPVEIKVHLIRDSQKKPLRYYAFVNDITTRKASAAAMESANVRLKALFDQAEYASRMKDEFLATLSHELRTPLNAILGWAQILRNGRGTPGFDADVTQGLEVIERNARIQTKIIEDLLDMSRIISGKIRLEIRRVELAPIIEASAETVRHAAEAKGVLLRLSLGSDPTVVSVDPARLQQVFWNLLSNSVKHCVRGGMIEVMLTQKSGAVEIAVLDDGEGIDPQFLPVVFDRFRQADSSTTRRHGGLGLGLSIVKQLVELHGGWVTASSPGRGRGATFIVSLPLSQDRIRDELILSVRSDDLPLDAQESPETPHATKLAGLRIVVVDNEPDAREMVRKLLEKFSAKVTVIDSAERALEAVKLTRPDLLLSDVGMPDEDGYSLIAKVRALPIESGGDLPAIALTAYTRQQDRIHALRAGFDGHISKPIEPDELIETIASVVRSRRPE